MAWCPAPTTLARFARAGLALISERRSVFAGLTVEENLRLGRGDIELAFEAFPELEALRHRRGGLLSGGEQQMLSLSRALSRRPALLMVDELSLGLGPIVVSRLLKEIRKAADAGLAVLMVEQRLDLALQVADRGHVLNRGVLALEASGDELGARLREVGNLYMGRGPTTSADGPKASRAD
jgi:ABC-type branched-subunit amino acid transport system ATPase component